MGPRSVLAGLIVVATVAFVIGTSIERGDSEANHAEGGAESGESAEHRAAEGTDQAGAGEREEEFMPFGIDIEAAPFIVLAAVASLALALVAWLRPRAIALLALVGIAMLAFAVLDVRESVHQTDESNTALAILAAIIALLHLGAAAVAMLMIRGARRDPESPAPAAAMRA
jgi:Flp pilus assembly protein TadB